VVEKDAIGKQQVEDNGAHIKSGYQHCRQPTVVKGVELDKPGKGDPEQSLNRNGCLEGANKSIDLRRQVHLDVEQGRNGAAQGHEGEHQVNLLCPSAQEDHQMQQRDCTADAEYGDIAVYEKIKFQSRSRKKIICFTQTKIVVANIASIDNGHPVVDNKQFVVHPVVQFLLMANGEINPIYWSLLFWDPVHPTSLGHTIVAGEADGVSQAGPNVVPIPAAVWLLGSGLVGLLGIKRKLKK